MKLGNIFKLVREKEKYTEKDQRIVARWLKDLDDEKMDADEVMNLCIRFLVSVTGSIYGHTSFARKTVIKRFDQRLKETFAIVQAEVKKGKFDE